ncbi:MAG: hypothetical protein HW402_362 [Dehalococcoidales bacterium]|nr:hypothetical protein [Dehalococcoidales bacterium]
MKSPKIFFGWWTVLSGGIIAFWAAGYATYGFSALFKPIAAELSLGRAAASVPASIARLEGGFEGPIAGWLADKFGSKWIIFSGVFLVAISLILMNWVNSLWAFYLVWGVLLGTGHNITSGVPIDKAIADWFVKKRGTALGIKWVLTGLSGAIVLPLVAWLIPSQGWRMTCVIGGLVMGLIGLPLAWFFFKPHRPEYYGLLPDGAVVNRETTEANRIIEKGIKYAGEVEEVEFTLRQAMKTPTYWLLIMSFAGFSLGGAALNIHLVPFLTDTGIDSVRAAGMVAMWVSVSVPFRFIGGFLADRVRKNQLRFIVAGGYMLKAIGTAIFLLRQTEAMIYVWFVFWGIGHGIVIAMMGPMRARYFGRKAFGSIQGTSAGFLMPVGVIAPIYLGWVYDTTGSYLSAFTVIAAVLAFAGVLAVFVLPPKPPAQVTDVRNVL